MISIEQFIAKYGNPEVDAKTFEDKWMEEWTMPDDLHVLIPVLPKVIYLNKDIAQPTEITLRALVAANVHKEIKTYEGCWVIRNQRGSTKPSTHGLGIAYDLNSPWNPFKIRGNETDAQWAQVRKDIVKWSPAFLQIWRDTGWSCGADWNHRIDGMHFQWNSL